MSSPNDYDAQVEAIREYNAPILSEFQKSLEKAGLSKKTVKSHVDNIDFFTEYLMYYPRFGHFYKSFTFNELPGTRRQFFKPPI